jgi:DnaJ-class molecular chaperone
MSGFKNFYPTLGLSDFADADTIKAAYRRLARQHHPDLNRDNPDAEETLKNLNAAYETLSDPIKKALHDRQLQIQSGDKQGKKSPFPGKSPSSQAQTVDKGQQNKEASAPPKQPQVDVTSKSDLPPPPSSSSGKKPEPSGNSFSELLDDWLGKSNAKNANASKGEHPKAPPPNNSPDPSIFEADPHSWKKPDTSSTTPSGKEKPRRGEDVHVKTAITHGEASQGVIKTVHVQHLETCRRCSGTGRVNGTACTACYGEKTHTRIRKMDVRIPPGVKTGSKVRVAKEGGRGIAGGEAGDLFLQIEISSDPSLRIEGMDVHGELSIELTDAVLGTSVEVTTVSGPYSMTIPAGTQSGRIFRLKELGVKHGLSTGDHFVTVTVHIPETLNPRERELYQELAKLRYNRSNSNK